MLSPDGYTLTKRIYAGSRSEIQVGVRSRDGREVLLKGYLDPELPKALARAEREFECLSRLQGKGVVPVVELVQVQERPVLVLERAPGQSLGEWVQVALPSVPEFLEMASQLVEVLSRVHAARLIHGDISPANVIVEPRTLQTHVIDFELTRPLGSALRDTQTPRELAGTLPYIAPESTGRMNRGIDARSDLYSLGATLYFALTGRPPFDGGDALTLIHAHMAKMPAPPVQLRASIPPTLSRIVSKLLQKSPEDRYQTAAALGRDLTVCRDQLRDVGRIQDDLPLGTADAPHRPLFARRLYGRDAEVARLQQSYASAAAGAPGLLLLAGPAGVGKSELVQALRTPLAESGGYLAPGKFDQYRELPYAGFASAFNSLAQQILTESDARLGLWQNELRRSLGAIAGALVGLVPDLCFVLGEVAPVPLLGPAEMRARLALAVRCFIQGVATREHPLVLCLDDLQWADAASLDLLRALLLGGGAEALLVLGSYRDGEVDALHPLSVLIEDLQRNGVKVESLLLTPLSQVASAEMLADALGRTAAETRSLAASVARKTGNAPLLIQQFIYHMYDLGLVHFQVGVGWTWNDAEIAAADIPDDAVGLLAAKITRLPPEVAAVLELASCAGDTFDPQGLVELTGRPLADLEPALFALCDDGFIAPAPQGFRFAHDRIREAARGLLAAEERARLHTRAAGLLLERTAPAALSERSFEIADHLLLGAPLVDEEERRQALHLYLLAGKRALGSGAAVTAARYFGAARQLFRDEQWATDLALGFDLFAHSADAFYQMREFSAQLALLDVLDGQPLHVLQAAQVAAKRIIAHTACSEPPEQLELIRATLRRFGVPLATHPGPWRVRFEMWRTERAMPVELGERAFPQRDLPERPHWLAQLIVAGASGSVLAVHARDLFAVLVAFVLGSRCRFGLAPGMGFSLAGWATLRAARLGDAAGCERYAQAAIEWSQRSNNPSELAKTEYLLQAYVYPFIRSRRSVLEPLRSIADRCFELGELEFGIYALLMRHNHMTLAGDRLEQLDRDALVLRRRVRGTRFIDFTASHNQLLDYVRGTPGGEPRQPSEAEVIAISAAMRAQPSSRFGVWSTWALVLALLGRFEELERELQTTLLQEGAAGVDVAFFRGVAAAALLAAGVPAGRRRGLRQQLRQAVRQVRGWSRQNPDFLHMAHALKAEQARVRGRLSMALAVYGQAIERAASRGYRHHAAFLLERRGVLLASMRRRVEAVRDLQRALTLYEEWGAHTKVAEVRNLIVATAAQR